LTDSSIDIINQAFAHKNPKRIPVVPLVGLYSANLIKSSVKELVHDSAKQAEAQLSALRRFHYDGVISCMDLTVEAEMLGAEVVFQDDGFPYVKNHPYSNGEDIERLKMPKIEDSRLGVFVDTTARLAEAVGDTHLVSSYVIGPFTLAGHLMGVDSLLELTIENPDMAISITETCRRLIAPYVDALAVAGAHNIIILEPTASTSIISPRFFERFAAPSLLSLNRQIKTMGPLSTLHICGDTTRILDSMLNTRANALSIDAVVDMAEAKAITRGKATLIGNIDTSILLTASPEVVTSRTLRCIEQAETAEGGHIVSTGCDVPLETPEENIHALVNAARNHPR
jgi:uroporphyrinogen decarboxylase